MKGVVVESSEGRTQEVISESAGDKYHISAEIAKTVDGVPGCGELTVFQAAPLVWWEEGEGVFYPIDADVLDLDQERNVLTKSLEEAEVKHGVKIDLVFETATTRRLGTFLATSRAQLLHFSCHGLPHHLVFEDGLGCAHFLQSEELKDFFAASRKKELRFVYVAACHSRPVGEAFINAGIPHVLCCEEGERIMDDAAIEICHHFYPSLACGKTVQESFNLGLQAVKLSPYIPDANNEVKKFLLLPEDADHNVHIFFTSRQKTFPPITRAPRPPLFPRSNLPHSPDVFEGRAVDTFNVLQKVRSVKLIKLIGSSGCGKRSLAVAAARYISSREHSFLIDEVIWLPFRKTAQQDKLSCSLFDLCAILQDKSLSASLGRNVEYKRLCQEIFESLDHTSVLFAIDSKPFLSSCKSLTSFLDELFVRIKDVRIILVCEEGFDISLEHNCTEAEFVVDPINSRDAAILFGKICKHVSKPQIFAELLVPAGHGSANTSNKSRRIWNIIAEGIPAKIHRVAKEMTQLNCDELMTEFVGMTEAEAIAAKKAEEEQAAAEAAKKAEEEQAAAEAASKKRKNRPLLKLPRKAEEEGRIQEGISNSAQGMKASEPVPETAAEQETVSDVESLLEELTRTLDEALEAFTTSDRAEDGNDDDEATAPCLARAVPMESTNPQLTTIRKEEVIDAYVVLQSPPVLLGDLDIQQEHARNLQRIKKDIESNQNTDLNDLVQSAFRICLADARKIPIFAAIESSDVRTLIWCAEGIDALGDIWDRRIQKDTWPKVTVVCMKYGAEMVAKRLQEMGADKIIWMGLDPYPKHGDLSDLYLHCFDPFLASVIVPGGHTLNEFVEILAEGALHFDPYWDHSGIGVVQNSDGQIYTGRNAKKGKMEVVLSMYKCHDMEWLESNEVRDLEISVCDLDLLETLKIRLKEPRRENFVLTLPPRIEDENQGGEVERKILARQRAVALELCKHCAQDSSFRGYAGIFHMSCLDDMRKIKERLVPGKKLILWADLRRHGFQESRDKQLSGDLITILRKAGKSIVILTSDARSMELFEMIQHVMEGELQECQLDEDSARMDISASRLHETICIRPIPGGNTEGPTCILDKVKAHMLEGILQETLLSFSSGGSDEPDISVAKDGGTDELSFKCHRISALYRDNDGSVKVRICMGDIRSATLLRDRIVTGDQEIRKRMASALNMSKEHIDFDRTAFAEVYEEVILRLDHLTLHQKKAMRECWDETRVHIKALAGSGKTFLAVNMALNYFSDSRNAGKDVLYVCANAALGMHFAKWLCKRSQRYPHECLKRLFLLSSAEKGIVGVRCDCRNELVEVRLDKEDRLGLKEDRLGLIIVDEAHCILGTGNEALAAEVNGLITKDERSSVIVWLLSDISQSSDIEGTIQYPEVKKSVELTEVVRSSQRIVAGSMSYQHSTRTTSKRLSKCTIESVGPPLKTNIFNVDQSERDQIYAIYAKKAIESMQRMLSDEMFPGLNLDDRLAIIVPDNDFRKDFCTELERILGKEDTIEKLEQDLEVITALQASKTLKRARISRQKARPPSRIVVDSVDNFGGLERLIVFGVGLDAPILVMDTGLHRNRVRRRIYCAMTRAHLMFYLINEKIQGGWFEWLTRVDMSIPFKFEDVVTSANDDASQIVEDTRPAEEKEAPPSSDTVQPPNNFASHIEREIAISQAKPKRQQKGRTLQEASSEGSNTVKLKAFQIWDNSTNVESSGNGHDLRFFPFQKLNELAIFQADPLALRSDREGEEKFHPVTKLDMEQEVKILTKCVEDAAEVKYGVKINLVFETATMERLCAFLAKSKAQALHLSCHVQQQSLILEDGFGGAQLLEPDKLKDLLSTGHKELRFVNVAACNSKALGEAFIDAGIPHVLCCHKHEMISEFALLEFCRGFYQALACGRTVQESFEWGLNAVKHSPSVYVPNAENEVRKFTLLPEYANHNTCIFTGQQEVPSALPPIAKASRPALFSHSDLPQPPDVFVGREVDVYSLVQKVSSSTFIKLKGSKGCGKRSLAAVAARYISSRKHSFCIEEVIWLPPWQQPKQDKLSTSLFDLCAILRDEDLSVSLEYNHDYIQLCTVIFENLNGRSALFVIDSISVALLSKNLSVFLDDLFRRVQDVRVILICQEEFNISVEHNCIESELLVGAINFMDAAILFGTLCQHVSGGRHLHARTPRTFAELIVPAGEKDIATSQKSRAIWNAIGEGVPVQIHKAAKGMTLTNFNELIEFAGKIEDEMSALSLSSDFGSRDEAAHKDWDGAAHCDWDGATCQD